jgi:hypothetical protein
MPSTFRSLSLRCLAIFEYWISFGATQSRFSSMLSPWTLEKVEGGMARTYIRLEVRPSISQS